MMKTLIFLFTVFFNHPGWLTDFDQAQKIASEKNEYILLNFSGSDWCGPCIRMKKELFDADEFMKYSSDHLVLVNADFPRNKKNKLGRELEKQNDRLADKYNPTGIFPYTILLNPAGKMVKEWQGFPPVNAGEFIQQIKQASATN